MDLRGVRKRTTEQSDHSRRTRRAPMERSASTEETKNEPEHHPLQDQMDMDLSTQSTQAQVKEQELLDVKPAQPNALDPLLQPFEEQFPRIVRTFKPRDERDVTRMVTILNHALSLDLDDEYVLLKMVEECNTEGTIADKLDTKGFSPGHAVVLAGVLAPLLGIGQASQEVLYVIEGIRQMDWPAKPLPGTKIDIPPLSISPQQRDRFSEGFVIYREVFKQIYNAAAAELGESSQRFRDSMPVYVHGPKGIGKSQAFRYVAAGLWHERLCKGGNFRVLYIAQWHNLPFAPLKEELQLCFHDDPVMIRKIDTLVSASDVMKLLVGYKLQRVVIIVDQAYDSVPEGSRNHIWEFFPIVSSNIRIVFASSPRFSLQGFYLVGSPAQAKVRALMSRLRAVECARLVCAVRRDPDVFGDVQFLERVQEALQPFASNDQSPDAKEDDGLSQIFWQIDNDASVVNRTDMPLGVRILAMLLESSGGVPLYVRDILRHPAAAVLDVELEQLPGGVHDGDQSLTEPVVESDGSDPAQHLCTQPGSATPESPTGIGGSAPNQQDQASDELERLFGLPAAESKLLDRVRRSCIEFDLKKADEIQERTYLHCSDVSSGHYFGYLQRWLESAISGRPANITDIVGIWNKLDLRFVLLRGDKAEPLCPAAFLGIGRALFELALETEHQDTSNLVQQLQSVIGLKKLSPSTEGYAKELAFLSKLAECKLRAIEVKPPTDSGEPVAYFSFTQVRMINGFDVAATAAVSTYDSLALSVLFLPRQPNEAYIDAAVYDYERHTIYAIQVTAESITQHKDSLHFFTSKSDNRWRTLLPYQTEQAIYAWEGNLHMVWVLTNPDPAHARLPQKPPPHARTQLDVEIDRITQHVITYDEFMAGTVADTWSSLLTKGTHVDALNIDDRNTTVEHLKAFCEKIHLTGLSGMSKSGLIAAIKNNRRWPMTAEEVAELRAWNDIAAQGSEAHRRNKRKLESQGPP